MSVQVIDKSSGKYKYVRTVGSSNNSLEIEKFVEIGEQRIKAKMGVVELDFSQTDNLFDTFLSGITGIHVAGIELLLGKIFDEIGFNLIEDELFRKLVFARLFYPLSKLKTSEYFIRYEGYSTNDDKI